MLSHGFILVKSIKTQNGLENGNCVTLKTLSATCCIMRWNNKRWKKKRLSTAWVYCLRLARIILIVLSSATYGLERPMAPHWFVIENVYFWNDYSWNALGYFSNGFLLWSCRWCWLKTWTLPEGWWTGREESWCHLRLKNMVSNCQHANLVMHI